MPIIEDDFEGLDMIRAITEGPHGKERFELELEYRLLASESMRTGGGTVG